MNSIYRHLTLMTKNIFLITLLSTALLFASCINDLFENDKSSKKQETQTEQTGSEELIPVKINISNKKQIENILQNVKPQKNISQARAASPQNVTLAYKILYKKVTETSPSSTVNQDNKEYIDELTDSSAVLQLSKGTWDFTLIAYYKDDSDNEKAVFSGNVLNQQISPGTSNSLSFTLQEISGNGNIKITLTIPASTEYTAEIKAQLSQISEAGFAPVSGYTESVLPVNSTDSTSNSYVYNQNDVQNGTFYVVFSITTTNTEAASDTSTASLSTETTVYPVPVRVVTNLTSESTETLSEIRNVCVITWALGDDTVTWKDSAPSRVYKKYEKVDLPDYSSLKPLQTKIFNGWKVQGSTDSESKTTMIIEQNVTLEPVWITTTLYVDRSADEADLTTGTAVKPLQDAVNKLVTYEALDDGDDTSYQHEWTINVNGTCFGNTWLIDTNKIDDLKITKLTIAGDNNAEDILDARTSAEGTASDAVITHEDGTFPLIIENLTIQKGSSSTGNGGGLKLKDNTAYLNNVILKDNAATGNGGAIALTNSNLFIYGGTVIGATTSTVAESTACSNKADGLGGGIWADKDSTIYFGYTGIDSATETMTAETGTPTNSITYNYAGASEANNGGGGIYCLGKLYTWGGTISYNSAGYGGGINTAYLSMKGSTVSYNTATATNADGGGIFINNEATIASYITSADFNGTKTLTQISNNYSQMTGGGIAFYKGELYISDTKIHGNTAVSYGGGIYVPAESSAKLFVYGTTTIGADSVTECATGDDGKHSNSAALGGGIYILSTSSASASAYINYSSEDDTEHTGTVNITYNYASSISENDGGGGIFAAKYSSLYIAGDTTINYNAAVQQGGGILCKSAPVTISDATISYNQAANGGGVYLDQINLSIKGATTFRENTAGTGGAISGQKYTVLIQEQAEDAYAYIEPDPVCNDVYLGVSCTISADQNKLSDTHYYIARFTPYSYATDIQYIYETVNETYKKFLVTPQSVKNSTTNMQTQVLWETKGDGKITTDNTTFVKIPAKTINETVSGSGLFMAGRELKLPSFYICDHEVTQGEYEKYCFYGVTINWDTWKQSDNAKVVKEDNYPACFVSWYDALVYCNLRSIAEGLEPVYYFESSTPVTNPANWDGVKTETSDDGEIRYRGPSPDDTEDPWSEIKQNYTKSGWRLPLEAEWEYAARGANGPDGSSEIETYLYSGSDTSEVVAWMGSNAISDGYSYPNEVKQLSPNRLGLYDMSGNVVELCWDWYSDDLSTAAITGPESNTNLKVAAPGGAYQWPRTLKAYIDGETPLGRSSNPKNARFCNAGFRIVRTITE